MTRFPPLRALVALGTLVIAAAPAAAATDPHARALAAGYAASFLCSGIFDAGQSEATVAADDLTGIYPEYQTMIATLVPVIDHSAKTVSVAFDPALPPRVAAWRPNLGCARLPIGAAPASVAQLPRFDAAPPVDVVPWPRGRTSPRVAKRLSPVIAEAFDHKTYGAGTETTAVLVVVDGHIVAEHYRAGYGPDVPQRTWSVAKSLTATLIGRAVQLGLLQVDAPAPVPEWQAAGDPRGVITLAQLMHMNSGLWTNGPGNRTDEVYLGSTTVDSAAAAVPLEAAPGTRFRYANNDTLFAMRGLRHALGDGERATAFPFIELFWKLGMLHTTPETDWRGNYILSSQVWTTARDLARVGQLYLDDGKWRGDQLLPLGWSAFVAAQQGVQPATAAEPGGSGYGAFFWRYGGVAQLPKDAFAMLGNRGQSVIIIPTRRAIIVRRGFDAAGKPNFEDARFAQAVLTALRP